MIMIIEDDATIRLGLKYYLEQEKYNVLESENGLNLLEQIKNNDISLILLDINLPDINGFELFKKIKAIKNIPLIFLTANDLELSVVKGLDMRADDYITKPFKARELMSRIINVLRRNSKEETNIIKIKDITIDTSIHLRRREFAVLRSVGLTPKGFNKILYFESIFLGLRSLLYGLPISFGVIILLHLAMTNMVQFESIIIPYKSIIIAFIGVFVIVIIQ